MFKKNVLKHSLSSKKSTSSRNRRDFIKMGTAVVGGAFISKVTHASSASGNASAKSAIEYLFVQNANKITLDKKQLRLSGISPTTIFFSDRPQRIAGHMYTEDFVYDWQKGTSKESFHDDPPNASVSVFSNQEVQDVMVTLKNPHFDGDSLIYDIDYLGEYTALESGPGSLFIDPIGQPLTPLSVAGVHRRERRRVRRAVVIEAAAK